MKLTLKHLAEAQATPQEYVDFISDKVQMFLDAFEERNINFVKPMPLVGKTAEELQDSQPSFFDITPYLTYTLDIQVPFKEEKESDFWVDARRGILEKGIEIEEAQKEFAVQLAEKLKELELIGDGYTVILGEARKGEIETWVPATTIDEETLKGNIGSGVPASVVFIKNEDAVTLSTLRAKHDATVEYATLEGLE